MSEHKSDFTGAKSAVDKDIILLTQAMDCQARNSQMPGDGRYQPEELQLFLGYDAWAGWLVLVEWYWLKTLARIGTMPATDAKLLTGNLLAGLLEAVTTTAQDQEEKRTKHDIIALTNLMREHLPNQLHRWLHFCATSYDIICTAYALQAKTVFERVFMPELRKLDDLWREKIKPNASVLQAGRTHLQTALPITVGFWLAGLHNRFAQTSRQALARSQEIPGKFSGAVGTFSAQRALIANPYGEQTLMLMLGLPVVEISTQITPPEGMARYYFELVLLSGALANLGEDVRILQSSMCGEITSASSTSSTMSHKKSNPIAAEQMAGMHLSVVSEFGRVTGSLVSDLGRDLRWSSVMRGQSAVMVYVFQQIKTAQRLLKSLAVDQIQCRKNFDADARLVVAELLHLALQRAGVSDAHNLVNTIIVPLAREHGCGLAEAVEQYLSRALNAGLEEAWKGMDQAVVNILLAPEIYLGDAVMIAKREAENKL